MERISNPLGKMNAKIQTTNGSLPLKIKGNNLISCEIDLEIPSAQIKSGLLLFNPSATFKTDLKDKTFPTCSKFSK